MVGTINKRLVRTTLNLITLVLVVIGATNLGLIAAFDLDVVAAIFGAEL